MTIEFSDPKLPKKSWVKIGQIRTLSTQRLGKKIGTASDEELETILEGPLDDRRVLLGFEPRIGTFFLEAYFRSFLSTEVPVVHSIFNWLTAVWILTLGIFLSLGRPLLKTYIISEMIFFLPSLLLNSVVVAVLISQRSFKELLYHLIPLFFSIIPLVWAIWLAWRGVSKESKRSLSQEIYNASNKLLDARRKQRLFILFVRLLRSSW